MTMRAVLPSETIAVGKQLLLNLLTHVLVIIYFENNKTIIVVENTILSIFIEHFFFKPS